MAVLDTSTTKPWCKTMFTYEYIPSLCFQQFNLITYVDSTSLSPTAGIDMHDILLYNANYNPLNNTSDTLLESDSYFSYIMLLDWSIQQGMLIIYYT